jgi:hypothetical protein
VLAVPVVAVEGSADDRTVIALMPFTSMAFL